MSKQIVLENDKRAIEEVIGKLNDIYRDFYITKNNIRYFIKDNLNLLWDAVEYGDKLYYGNDFVIYIGGFSDNATRKYIKILLEDKVANFTEILRNHCLEFKDNLYIKVKKNNPIIKVLEFAGFKRIAGRGKETLYCFYNIKKV